MPSEQNGEHQGSTTPGPTTHIDLKKLQSLPKEQQDLYLLTSTSGLVHHVVALDSEAASAQQTAIKKELLDLINSTTPAPTRIIRNNLGACFGELFRKCNRKLLYESINDLSAIINAGKEKDHRTKHAALVSLGHLMQGAGDSAVSLSAGCFAAALKLLKSATNHAGLRAAIFKAIGRIISGLGGSVDETSAKDIWKASRSALTTDKAHHVQIDAAWCLEQLLRHTMYFETSADFEKLQTAIWKVTDSSSSKVRHAAISCLSEVLVKCYTEVSIKDIALKKPKKVKGKPKEDEAEEEIERAATPTLQKPVLALSFDLIEILKLLSTRYTKTTSNRTRAATAICYRRVIAALGEKVIEANYSQIVAHMCRDLLDQPSIRTVRYRYLMTRKFVRILLADVIHAMCGESAQINAARYLINDVLKDFPKVLNERPEPSKAELLGALIALEDLITRLGPGIQPLADSCREALSQVLQHPSYTVQIYASRCFKLLVSACPLQLLSSITLILNSLVREVGFLSSGRQSPRKCIGYAHGLAALLTASARSPLYGSIEVYMRVLEQATAFLKSSSSSNVKISATQVQVSWIMIGGLMSLGPNFVKIHLPQLLLMWKNALPPPPLRDELQKRVMIEQSFLAHVRECALGSIITFLHHNSRLVTADVAKRLATMLTNTTSFLAMLPSKKTTEDIQGRLTASLQLQDFDIMVRRRVFQCFALLVMSNPSAAADIVQESNVVGLAVGAFADPENYQPSSLSVSIASSIGSFASIWDMGDNSGFGVTGIVEEGRLRSLGPPAEATGPDTPDADRMIEQVIKLPFGDGWEYDASTSYSSGSQGATHVPQPPATELVNAAIRAFALAFPHQSPRLQASILEQMVNFMASGAVSPKDPARRAAVNVNIAVALLLVANVLQGHITGNGGRVQTSSGESAIKGILEVLLIDIDENVRALAAEALGRVSSVCGNDFTNMEVKSLVDMIVAQREPASRAGCALALSFIHSQLGGMAAGYHLKTIVGLLMSLAADQHPTVHYWALESLARVAVSAGLTFSGHVSGCIGLLGQLYTSDDHNIDCASDSYANLECEASTVVKITETVDSIINVLGPDLQDLSKTRDIITTLLSQLQLEEDSAILGPATTCREDLAVYASGHIDFTGYVEDLQHGLSAPTADVQEAALSGLVSLLRKDASSVFSIAQDGLEDKLWELLDERPDRASIKSVFENWLQQDGLVNCHGWVRRCNKVLTKSRSRADDQSMRKQTNRPAIPDMQDEEVAGFAAAVAVKDEEVAAPAAALELMRWQVRLFAMDLLQELIAMIAKDAVDNEDSAAQASLQREVSEVIKIAFSASTAGVVDLRIRGLRILNQILKMFGGVPDPDFLDAMLLEQYQAQISSALTPAFAADSSPELAAEAVSVCATFISVGIVADIERMGRIHRLLVSALESLAENSVSASIGDLKGLCANTQVMVRMAVFSAWADLQIASIDQKFLEPVVKPHVARLTPLWLSSLREYAQLRFEPDASGASSTLATSNPDTLYAALNRDTRLQISWLRFVDAIASLIDEDSDFVYDALDGKTKTTEHTNGVDHEKKENINYRDEPTAFFFVLFGLAFEALAARFDDRDPIARARRLDILRALKKILRPSVAGNAIYQDVIFSETMDLLDRMVLTEGLDVQTIIVEIARNMVIVHPSSHDASSPVHEDRISDDIDQLFELTRIIVLVIAGLVPGLAPSNRPVRSEISDEGVVLIRLALDALVDAAEVFPSIIKGDLHACIFHLFVTILGTASCQSAVVPGALPIFRRFLENISRTKSQETSGQIRSTLGRFMLILRNAQKRENEAALPCEKNTLLASTILVTTAHTALDPADSNVHKLVHEVVEALANPMTTKMATGCARTLLLLPTTCTLRASIISAMLPKLVHFFVTPSTLQELDESIMILASALTAFALSGSSAYDDQDGSGRATCAIVIAALLGRAWAHDEHDGSNEMAADNRLIAGKLLELARADQQLFRACVARLKPEERTLMERVLREGGASGARHGGRVKEHEEGNAAHRIALRMDF